VTSNLLDPGGTLRHRIETELRTFHTHVTAAHPGEQFSDPVLTWNQDERPGLYRHSIRFEWLRRGSPPEPVEAGVSTETRL